ncbi:MAG: hypothetical protein CUN55_13310 [Phototrophicales bacterium]|nr:MAG: hypothetical protein CUN55_13310 [Phototrophicales bacterium]
MSKVVSFRLDEEHPEERQALAILEAWQEKGYTTREILTWALMSLDGIDPLERSSVSETSVEAKATIDELRDILGQAQAFLEALKSMKALPDSVDVPGESRAVLTQDFLASVRKVMRPGLSLEKD